jgi:heme-degrading monooxygenase HmoA
MNQVPEPPYWAVVFTSFRTGLDEIGYEKTAARMLELAAEQPGYLGIDSVRDADGVGITVSYWSDPESIRKWRNVAEHLAAQEKGRSTWYGDFRLRICRVEREYGLPGDS